MTYASPGLIASLMLLLVACETSRPATPTPAFTPSAMNNLRWIEGTWHDMTGITVPYETYRFVSDSLMVIHNYEDRGLTRVRDSSRVYWQDSAVFYETARDRWRAIRLDTSIIAFEAPNPPRHHFVWKRDSADAWTATLETTRTPLVFSLERVK